MKNRGEGEHQLYRRAAGFFLAMVRRRSAVLCGRREPCFKGHLREPSPRTLRWLDYRKSAGGGLALAQRNSTTTVSAHRTQQPIRTYCQAKARCKDSVKIDENA